MKNNLKIFRDEMNLSQDALGSELNVSRQTITSIDNGKFAPSIPIAMKLAQFFDCKI
mgnify:CR=1 FL=1